MKKSKIKKTTTKRQTNFRNVILVNLIQVKNTQAHVYQVYQGVRKILIFDLLFLLSMSG